MDRVKTYLKGLLVMALIIMCVGGMAYCVENPEITWLVVMKGLFAVIGMVMLLAMPYLLGQAVEK